MEGLIQVWNCFSLKSVVQIRVLGISMYVLLWFPSDNRQFPRFVKPTGLLSGGLAY